MKRKIALLITGCIITVAALACIQGYFVYNTYKLYLKEVDSVIRQRLLEPETKGKFDSINHVWMRSTHKFMYQYQHGTATKADYKEVLDKTRDSLSNVMSQYITKEHFFEDYNVSYNNYIQSVVLLDGTTGVMDTIIKGHILIYGNNTEHVAEIPASESRWDNEIKRDSETEPKYMYEVTTRRTYTIANWQQQVAYKMIGMLIFTGALLAFVVLLFYLSIKNLITQKKIADIKTDFINNITHEFQTPIAAMDIAVKTLQRKKEELTPEQFTITLSIIGRQNHRMQKLFSQVSQASLDMHTISTDQATTLGCEDIEEIVHDFILSHPNAAISCPEGKELKIHMDRFHLATILLNLLDNAVKYGGTKIDITLENTNGYSILSVTDNGIGISKKEKTAIFDKFYRVQKGDIHTTKGLGLGLHYVQQITEAYNGSIAVTGEEGHGSTFTLSIPLA